MGLLHHGAKAVLMDKLAHIKLCGATGCSYKHKLKEGRMSVSVILYSKYEEK